METENQNNKLEELKELLNIQTERGVDVFNPKVKGFIDATLEKYGRGVCQESLYWHMLNNSVPVHITLPNLDLPGGEVEDFIRNTLPNIKEVE